MAGKSAPPARAGAAHPPPRPRRHSAAPHPGPALTCPVLRRRRLLAPGTRSAAQATATIQLRRPHPRLSRPPPACPARRYTGPPPTAMARSTTAAAAAPTDGARARRRRARARAHLPGRPPGSLRPAPCATPTNPRGHSGPRQTCGTGRARQGKRPHRRLVFSGCLPGPALPEARPAPLRGFPRTVGSGFSNRPPSAACPCFRSPLPRHPSVPRFSCWPSLRFWNLKQTHWAQPFAFPPFSSVTLLHSRSINFCNGNGHKSKSPALQAQG